MASPSLWSIELEMLTAAFIGGARPRIVDPVTPLRPTAVRGALRQWFRYALGAVLAPRNLEDTMALKALRELETEVFGSTERASAVVMGPPAGGTVRDFPVPDAVKGRGHRYLGYGLFDRGMPQCLEAPARGDQRLRFNIGLRREALHRMGATPGAPDRSTQGIEAVLFATLWLWSNFGGIGARSRRGWGAVAISGMTPHDLRRAGGIPWRGPRLDARFDSLPALLKGLSDGLDEVLRVFGEYCQKRGHRLPPRNQAPMAALRTIAGIDALRALPLTWDKPRDAMELTGRLFQDFRSTFARSKRGERPLSDYFEVKGALQGKADAPRSVVRAAFGLPLPFYFRSLGGQKASVLPRPNGALGEGNAVDRLPSSLLLRPHLLADDARGTRRYAMTLIDLSEASDVDHLVGHDVQLSGGQRVKTKPDGQIVAEFMRWAIEHTAHYDEELR